MRARAVLFACALFVLASPALHAQTLDELTGPLLPGASQTAACPVAGTRKPA